MCKGNKFVALLVMVFATTTVFAFQAGDVITISKTISGVGTVYLKNDLSYVYSPTQTEINNSCKWILEKTSNSNQFLIKSNSANKYLKLDWYSLSLVDKSTASALNVYDSGGTNDEISGRMNEQTVVYLGLERNNDGWTTWHWYQNENKTVNIQVDAPAKDELQEIAFEKESQNFTYGEEGNIPNLKYSFTCKMKTAAGTTITKPADLINKGVQFAVSIAGSEEIALVTPTSPNISTYITYDNSKFYISAKYLGESLGAAAKATITVSATFDGETKTATATAERDIYREVEINDLVIVPDSASITLDYANNVYRAINLKLQFRHGVVIEDEAGHVINTSNLVTETFPNDQYSTVPENAAFTFTFIDNETGEVATWVAEDGAPKQQGNNYVMQVTFAQNELAPRFGEIHVQYMGPVGPYTETQLITTTISVAQSSKNAKADQVLVHKKGYANTSFAPNGLQKVHEVEKTFYVKNGDKVTLNVKEPTFVSWYRWFNYENDRNISYGTPLTVSYAGPTPTSISSGATSQGEYLTRKNNYNYSVPTITVGDMGTSSYHVACDISNYCDYGENNQITNTVGGKTYYYEPTLSYREIFHFMNADIMVDSLNKCQTSGDKYYETYTIIAPMGKVITLTPEFGYKNLPSVERYIYKLPSHSYHRVGDNGSESATWYTQRWENGKPSGTIKTLSVTNDEQGLDNHINTQTDYLCIEPTRLPDNSRDIQDGDTVLYMLRTPTFNLCKFLVVFRDRSKVGPTSRTIISYDEMSNTSKYDILGSLTFDYEGGPGTTSYRLYDKPLPWEESAAGFTYANQSNPAISSEGRGRYTTGGYGGTRNLAFWGEYAFINKITTSQGTWYQNTNQHGNGTEDAAKGYMLFCDGTQMPGLVARLAVDADLCAGQKMFCSAWISNVNSQKDGFGSLPKFKFVIEGYGARVNPDTKWHQIATFLTGDLDKIDTRYPNIVWKQINFSIDLREDYDKYRVSVYNFATTADGNDFAIDDIYIYATRPPLSVFQASNSCMDTEGGDEGDPIQVVMRLDYQNLADFVDNTASTLYYEFVEGDSRLNMQPYFLGNSSTAAAAKYGSIQIPDRSSSSASAPFTGNDPNTGKPAKIYDNFTQFVNANKEAYETYMAAKNAYEADKSTAKKNAMDAAAAAVPMVAYVKDGVNSTTGEPCWVMYVIHEANLKNEHTYELHMAYDVNDLNNKNLMCALSKEFTVIGQVSVQLNGEPISDGAQELCANGIYQLDVQINHMEANETTGQIENVTGSCYCDWFIGDEELIGTTDDDWEAYCGYDYSTVVDAIQTLRSSIKNIGKKFFAELVPDESKYYPAYNNKTAYDIVKDLVNQGLLEMYIKEKSIVMPAGAPPVAYTLFPVIGTGVKDDCDENCELPFCAVALPITLKVRSNSKYEFQIGAYSRDLLPEPIKYKPVQVRVSKNNLNEIYIPLQEMLNAAMKDDVLLVASTDPDAEGKWFGFHPDKSYRDRSDWDTYYRKGNTIKFTAFTDRYHQQFQMKEGYEYTFEIKLQSMDGQDYLDGGCPIGSAFFTLIVVPEYEMWLPNDYTTNWSNDGNWVMIDPKNWEPVKDNRKGYVPMGHTNVILEKSDIESYPTMVTTDVEMEKEKDSRYYESYDINYTAEDCRDILFRGDAKMLNQHLLNYNKAFVDMHIPVASWNIVSSPLKDVYSGDMFIPTKNSDANPFAPGQLTERSKSSGYPFYMSIYNSNEVKVFNVDGQETTFVCQDGGWSKLTNDVATPFTIGSAVAILGYNKVDSNDDLNVRLPKSETAYGYFVNGELDKTRPYSSLTKVDKHNLAISYNENTKMEIELQNATSELYTSNFFIFGNPSMAYLDMTEFFKNETNKANFKNTYYKMEGGELRVRNEEVAYYNLVPPMTGVVLEQNDNAEHSTVVITPNMLLTKKPDLSSSSQQRVAERVKEFTSKLTITAILETFESQLFILKKTSASNAYVENEDAMLLTSGNNNFSSSTLYTPFSLFAIEDDKALSIDARNTMGMIPIAFSTMFAGVDEIMLHFNISNSFGEDLFIYDALTDKRYQIFDNLYLTLDMPANGEVRYYLQGSKNNNDDGTGIENNLKPNIASDDLDVHFIAQPNGNVTTAASETINSLAAYDIAGRLIAAYSNVNNKVFTINLPKGAALIKVSTNNGFVTGKVLVQ